jgi:osmotically-inducible protein OsmY
MNRHKLLYVLASVLIFSGPLAGCAIFGRCGLGGCPGDAKVTGNVGDRLLQDPETAPPNTIYVQTSNREVYLSGLVDSRSDKEEAEEISRQLPGVTRVVNAIAGHGP